MRIRWPLTSSLLAIALTCISSAVAAERVGNPLSFFDGKTESESHVSVVSKKPYASTTRGSGRIAADGSLYLVQRVQDEGKKPFQRSWHMWQTAPGHFQGSMSDAVGRVTADEVAGRYRFRFRMKGLVDVEQWITPAADGRSASSETTIRKFGFVVGHSRALIRRVSTDASAK